MLLNAKFIRPAHSHDIVDRPRLYSKLAHWRDLRAVIIHAPAGYGKSLLVNRWLDISGLDSQAAWVSLDENDSDPVRFVQLVASALDRVRAGVLNRVRPILDDNRVSPERAWIRLLNTLPDLATADVADPHLLLVLDDLHRIAGPEVNGLLLSLLEHGPETLHLIIVARYRTDLPLARLFAHGKIAVMDRNDLRFNDREIAAYLLNQGFDEPSQEDVARLASLCEGWITGLRLAVLAQAEPGNFSNLIQMLRGDRQWLVAFLADEVLDRQPPAMQRFMLQIAILDEFNGPLSAAVTCDPAANAHLSALTQADLFLTRLDNGRRSEPNSGAEWFRFHHLFQEMLQNRLQAQYDAANIAALHHRAARWLAEAGHTADAVHHFLAAGDEDAAADLVEGQMKMVVKLTPYEAKRLLHLLPRPVIERRPRLMLDRCFLAMVFDELLTLERVEQAAQALQDHGLTAQHAPGLIGELNVFYSSAHLIRGEWTRVSDYATEALKYVEYLPGHIAGTLHFLCMYQQVHHDKYQAARRHGEQALSLYAKADFALGVIAVRRTQAVHKMDAGHSQSAQQQFQAIFVDPITGRPGVLREVLITYLFAAEERYWADDLAQARVYQAKAADLAHQLQDDDMMQLTHRMRALYDGVDRSQEVFVAGMTAASSHIASQPAFDMLLDIETRLLIAQGHPEVAWEVIQSHGIDWVEMEEHIAKKTLIPLLRAYIARGVALEDVTALLTKALARSTADGFRFRRLQLLALTAWQQLQRSDAEAAKVHLTELSWLANETGYVRVVLDTPAVVSALNALDIPVPSSEPDSKASGMFDMELTEREQAVLNRLAEERSYAEIAADLVVSVNTVRTHVRNIYRKLSANRREQAITRARLSGLLPFAPQSTEPVADRAETLNGVAGNGQDG